VVLGNPPYSGVSSNKGAWINGLLKGAIPDGQGGTISTASYYHIDGKPLGEKKTWLQDDYVKFIRWAQWRVEQTGHGILSFITNHGYLDNPTFRGMRWSLMQAFDDIYVLDLHGNTKKKEVCPDGSPDKNVFDIQQGVAIGIFVKRGREKDRGKLATVHHADLWGKRNDKYEWLAERSVKQTEWEQLKPAEPFYLFKPFDRSEVGDYYDWPAINEVIPVNSVGIVTGRDGFVIDFDRTALQKRIEDFAHGTDSDDAIRERYLRAKDKIDVHKARTALAAESVIDNCIRPVLYRPFDSRWICYHDAIIERSRREAMPHMLAGENHAIISARSNKFPEPNHFFASKTIVETKCGEASTQSATFPLYVYPGVGKTDQQTDQWPAGKDGRRPNLDPGFVQTIEQATKWVFVSDSRGDLGRNFGPEDMLAYIYAVFHWPEYRRRYEPMLKLDFPRIPPPEDKDRFINFARLGHELLAAHLLEDDEITGDSLAYPVQGENRVEKGYPKYVPPNPGDDAKPIKAGKIVLEAHEADGRVYINPKQYFEGVEPEVWQFQIGGYQVCEKWLKDRRGRTLSYDDLTHYTRIVESLRKTIDLMNRIELAGEIVAKA